MLWKCSVFKGCEFPRVLIQRLGVRHDVPFLLWAFLQSLRQTERQGEGPVPLKGHLRDDVPPGLPEGRQGHRPVHGTPRHGQVLRPALLCKEPEPEPLPHGVHLPLHGQRHGVLPPALLCPRRGAKGRQARHVPRRTGAGPLPLQGQEAAPPPGRRRGAVPLHRHPGGHQDAHELWV